MLERGLVKGEAELEITRGPFSPTLLPFDVYRGLLGMEEPLGIRHWSRAVWL